jgi:hypothetical protein
MLAVIFLSSICTVQEWLGGTNSSTEMEWLMDSTMVVLSEKLTVCCLVKYMVPEHEDVHLGCHGGGTVVAFPDDVPGLLNSAGLLQQDRLLYTAALQVGDPDELQGLKRVVEQLDLVVGLLQVRDVLAVGICVDSQYLVALVPVVITLQGQDEGFMLGHNLSQTVFVLADIYLNVWAGLDSMMRDSTVFLLDPLHKLKVVHVDQDFELGG